MLHTDVSAWYIALNRMLFSLWAVSASSNFSVADLASKQSTQRAVFILQQPKHPDLVLMCIMQQPGGFWLHVGVVYAPLVVVVMLQDLQIEVL